MGKREYRRDLVINGSTGSCSTFCTNICTRLYVVGVQECIEDCLACSSSDEAVIFLTDPDLLEDDD